MIYRTYCDTLREMRDTLSKLTWYNTRRCQAILGMLIEECQIYGNRMEAGLGQKNDFEELHLSIKNLRKEEKELIERVNELRKEAGKAPLDRMRMFR